MEVKFAKDELDEMQIKERVKLEFTGLDVWFSSIETNIAFKEEYLKSDKDIEDARHLRIVYEGKINEKKIEEIKEREINALLKSSKELRCNNLIVITWDYEAEEKTKGKKIKFIPLWRWLLS